MKIEQILQGIRESQAAEKTASVAVAAPVTEKTATTRTALVAALNDALTPAAEKTAAAAPVKSPVDDVMKVAEELAGAEKEAAVKEAQILGAAFADTAIARFSEWNKVAAEMIVANAPSALATYQTSGPDFQKFSQENSALVKQAAQLGYDTAKAELEKQAQDEYVRGYNDTIEALHKTAALEFLKAAAVTAEIIKSSRAA